MKTATASDTEPDYAVVFPQDSVKPDRYHPFQRVLERTANRDGRPVRAAGCRGIPVPATQGCMPGRQAPGGQPPAGDRQPPEGLQPEDQQAPGNRQQPGDFQPEDQQAPGDFQPGNRPGGNMGGMNFGDTSYVSSTATFNGETWNSVGFRYSGNSTLQTSWRKRHPKNLFPSGLR